MPRLLVDRADFRIVETEIDEQLFYVLEVPYGCDALGVERWRTFEQNNGHVRAVVKMLIDLALELEGLHGKRS